MAGPWGRVAAALGPPEGGGDPPHPPTPHPALRALRRPRPSPRHQTELLLLLLESPRELVGGATPEGSPESPSAAGGALLELLSLPPTPPPGPPRALLLLATLTFLLATGDWGGVAALGGLLVAGEGGAGGAPAAEAECLRELRRVRKCGVPPQPPPPAVGPPPKRFFEEGGRRRRPQTQARILLVVEEGQDPVNVTEPRQDPAPPSAFLLTPAARAQLLLLLQNSGGSPPGTPPEATADPAPLQAALLLRGGPPKFPPPPRLATLAQHPALPPPLRLFFLLFLLEGGGNPQKGGVPKPLPLPPHLAAPLFPFGGGALEPPEVFLPRFEAAAALWRGEGTPQFEGGEAWLRGALVFLGGGPPVLFCRAVRAFHRWLGFGGQGGLAEDLGGAAETLLAGGHPTAPPALLELAQVLGGPLGGLLRGKVLRSPLFQPPPCPALRGVLRALRGAPPHPGDPPQMRGFLRRAMAAQKGGWGGAQGVLSAAAPFLLLFLSPRFSGGPPVFFWGGHTHTHDDPDVGDRARLHAALAAALGPPKLGAVLGGGGR